MKSKILVISGCIALGLCFSLNVRNTLNDYDIPNISLVNAVWAQNGSGTGSDSGGGTSGIPCIREIQNYQSTYEVCRYCPHVYNPEICYDYHMITKESFSINCIIPPSPDGSLCEKGNKVIAYTIDSNCITHIDQTNSSSNTTLIVCKFY